MNENLLQDKSTRPAHWWYAVANPQYDAILEANCRVQSRTA